MAAVAVDENVSVQVAALLRHAGHDALSFTEPGLRGAGDQEVLLRAAREHRIVVSHDLNDFMLLHAAWQLWTGEWGVHVPHSGILLIRNDYGLTPMEIFQEVSAFLAADLPIGNELYAWRRPGGWVRRVA